ncbi:hypothetical protein ACTWPT_34530 [Nonomuraea sp. 3N208]|uniref:hypothetical protein n=1 Tax=Nonomuraea sp. 3N208 TaxID=3457421 RepID=UPI003FD1804C
MPDLLAATYALRPRNELARSALPNAPVKGAKQRKTRTFGLPFMGMLTRRTVKPIS